MEKTKFIKETDRKGTYIVEGWVKPKNVFSIKQFVCLVQEQETEKETQALADHLIKQLEKAQKWDELDEKISKYYPDEPNDDNQNDGFDDGLIGIGEAAALAFGYL